MALPINVCPHFKRMSTLSSFHPLIYLAFSPHNLVSSPTLLIQLFAKSRMKNCKAWSLSLYVLSAVMGMVLHALFLEILLPGASPRPPLSFFPLLIPDN